ncbi:shikimate kinase [Streptococcus downei]|uniref:Shikimate kinase n=1 Tax=Streptococcus downei MFe28 TaxID=764290 RepID=A0A380JDJ7_STRDO|nr:shikimate kinase [Streptococcus downei]EFQ56820.1 shikimate kinase [Streptococcus downei F0415]SUN36091.1 shikimate kinase [Streptococcus downei MFe28]
MAKILIGFMGSGKSTIARLLDENFVDMDSLITQKIGMPIADFFATKGEEAFRAIEAQTLAELADSDQVIATGGGVVTSPANREILATNPETIYLKADFDTLYDRIAKDETNVRPLFVNNSKEDFQAIFDGRQRFYEDAANIVIDVTNKTPEEIVEEIG